jgi:hypothetical protein
MSNPNLLPGFGQSRTADPPPADPTPPDLTPEDPREHEPMRDPPIHPEHDAGEDEVPQAGGVAARDPPPDRVILMT